MELPAPGEIVVLAVLYDERIMPLNKLKEYYYTIIRSGYGRGSLLDALEYLAYLGYIRVRGTYIVLQKPPPKYARVLRDFLGCEGIMGECSSCHV